MPKYGGVHYPNSVKGTGNSYPTHVPNDFKGVVKNGYPTHVKPDSSGFGDSFTKSLDDGAVGPQQRRSVLNEYSDYSWKYPKPKK